MIQTNRQILLQLVNCINSSLKRNENNIFTENYYHARKSTI